jgi:hypothetical protein
VGDVAGPTKGQTFLVLREQAGAEMLGIGDTRSIHLESGPTKEKGRQIDRPFQCLTYLDRLGPGQAFPGTTNLELDRPTERFQPGFLPARLQPPENKVLAAFLASRWNAPIGITRKIAAGANGNIRAAMADLEMWMG